MVHPVSQPRPLETEPAIVSWDDEAVCFHVIFPWKPHNTGLTIGEIKCLPTDLQGALYGLDEVEEVLLAVEEVPFIMSPDAKMEVRRRLSTVQTVQNSSEYSVPHSNSGGSPCYSHH